MRKMKKWLTYFLPVGLIALVVSLTSAQTMPHFKGRQEGSVLQMYSEDNLSGCTLFSGGFTNFGYWKERPTGTISNEQRVESSAELYRQTISGLPVKCNVLEVGSGQGSGAKLIQRTLQAHVTGVDLSPFQVAQAEKNAPECQFKVGKAESLPFADGSFDAVVSIEAPQHFEDLNAFFKESARVLNPGGTLVISGFFGTSPMSEKRAAKQIQTVSIGTDHVRDIHKVLAEASKAGFTVTKCRSIGAHVFPGFDSWVAQGDLKDSWTRNWYTLYQHQVLDYYTIVLTKPAP